jgi:hypothetical protein
MNTRTFVAISIVVTASALGAQKAPDITPYLIANRAAEVALARTAAPSAISQNATVLVLTPKGYTEAEHGTNGFTCLVMRSFAAAPDDPAFWTASIRRHRGRSCRRCSHRSTGRSRGRRPPS